MKNRIPNLTGYLFGNLLILCVILLGLWRGQPVWDTTLRLPNLLLILVILNTVLIFREAVPKRGGPGKARRADLTVLRRTLADRTDADADLIPEALNTVLVQTHHQGMALFLAEENGSYSLLNSVGTLPAQLSGIRWTLRKGDLIVRHPGNLGEETILGWETAWICRRFRSQVTRLDLFLAPLHLLGRRNALLAVVPGRARPEDRGLSLETAATFLEGVIGVHFTQNISGDGRFVDSRTGLLRYDGFKEAFETEIERSERYNQSMTLMVLSLTPFDELGEPARENLTKAVAASLRASLRRLDLMFTGREPGGFSAILTETNPEIARMVAGRVLSAFQKQVQNKDTLKSIRARIHLGTATYPSDATHGAGLLEKADEALAAARSRDVSVVAFATILDETAGADSTPKP